MKPPLFVRPLTDEERHDLEVGLRSKHAFTLRRCQIVLASAQRHTPAQIAQAVGCSVQTGPAGACAQEYTVMRNTLIDNKLYDYEKASRSHISDLTVL